MVRRCSIPILIFGMGYRASMGPTCFVTLLIFRNVALFGCISCSRYSPLVLCYCTLCSLTISVIDVTSGKLFATVQGEGANVPAGISMHSYSENAITALEPCFEDRRITRSKKALRGALIFLMEEKGFDSITVTTCALRPTLIAVRSTIIFATKNTCLNRSKMK